MPDKQPEALRLADALERRSPVFDKMPSVDVAVRMLRTQHAAIERKDALLRQALDMLRSADAGFAVHPSIFSAITKELSQ